MAEYGTGRGAQSWAGKVAECRAEKMGEHGGKKGAGCGAGKVTERRTGNVAQYGARKVTEYGSGKGMNMEWKRKTSPQYILAVLSLLLQNQVLENT